MIGTLTKQYDKFSAKERIQLTLAAIARADEEEVKRLKKSCPRKHYLQTDVAYSDKMENLEKICSLFVEFSQHIFIQILSCDFCWINNYEKAKAFEEGFSFAAGNTLESHPSRKEMLEQISGFNKVLDIVEQASAKRISELIGLKKAFQDFCDRVELDFNYLLSWSGLLKLYPEMEYYLNQPFEPAYDLYNQVVLKFLDIWDQC